MAKQAKVRIGFIPREVAEMLGVDVVKVLTWIHSGELQAINIVERKGGRGRYLIRQAELDEFLERRKTGSPPPQPCRRAIADGVIKFY